MSLRRRPLLVIEDSDDDYAILEECLEATGVPNRLERCTSGADIVAYMEGIHSRPTSDRPVLIILDLNLPGVHGTAVLEQLKAHPVLAPTPVVVLTTSSQQSDIQTCYRLGAGGFLTKPVDLDQFEEMVRRLTDYWFSCVQLPENVSPSTNAPS